MFNSVTLSLIQDKWIMGIEWYIVSPNENINFRVNSLAVC